MKTKLVAVIALIFCAFMAEASKVEGNGNIITKEISVDNYSEIELGGNIEYSGNNFWGNRSNKKFPVFKYTHGRSASLKITIDENLFPLLSIKSNNGRLAIRIQDGTRIKPTQYVIEGSSKTLKYLKTSGPMDFEAQNAFSEDQLEIKISGSSAERPSLCPMSPNCHWSSASGNSLFTAIHAPAASTLPAVA